MFHKLESTEKLNDLLHTHFPRLSILLQERLYFANRIATRQRPGLASNRVLASRHALLTSRVRSVPDWSHDPGEAFCVLSWESRQHRNLNALYEAFAYLCRTNVARVILISKVGMKTTALESRSDRFNARTNQISYK